MTLVSSNPTPPTAHAASTDNTLVILLALWPVMGILAGVTVRTGGSPADVARMRNAVDPNVAPWWELAVLPRIGPSTARAIIDQRNAARQPQRAGSRTRTYESADDLTRVRGIGPKTIERIAPYLALDHR